jgi:type I restriction enzyme, S subunit
VKARWTKYRIGEIGIVITGRTPPTSQLKMFGDKYPFITPSDMKGQKRIRRTERCLSEEGSQHLRRIAIPSNSIIVSCIGWQMGKAAITSKCSFTNQQINSIIPDTKLVNPDFLYYSLSQRKAELLSFGSAAGVRTPIINRSEFVNLQISLPPIDEQNRIASILTPFDDLIENNNRRIQILEEMAQAIYREWFVHFRFPGHEQVRMVESELGMIPEGWEVKRLKDFITVIRVSTQPGTHLSDLFYVPIDCISTKSLLVREVKPWSEANSSLFLFSKDDVLFGAMRPYYHKVAIAPFDGVTRSTCFVLRPTNPTDFSYVAMSLFQNNTVKYASNHSRGTTIPYAVWDGALGEMPIVYPSRKIRNRFNEHIKPLLERTQLFFYEQKNLSEQREILIPHLLNLEHTI